MDFSKIVFPCILYNVFGIYCPGCGGTRSIIFLLQGKIIESFLAYPATLIVVVGVSIFVIKYILSLLLQKVKKPKLRISYLFIVLGVIVVNWIIRNILLIRYGITIIGQ